MAPLLRITGPGRAESLAQELNTGRRTRPAVVVTVPGGATHSWIDADRLAVELGDLADVCVLATFESNWAFSQAMPDRTQVYGGAGRVYPVGLDWVREPARARLRFAYDGAQGVRTTDRLIEDALAPAASAPAQVTGVVKGCPTHSQALVDLDGSYATIQLGMTLPGVASERVFRAGMRVSGVLDRDTGRLDVRASLPDPPARLALIADGDVLWARVESVSRSACEIAPYPGATVAVAWDEVTTSADDDLHDLMSVGEVVAVRAHRAADGTVGLTLIGVDDLDAPCSALSVFPGGPEWLSPPEAAPPRPEDGPAEDVRAPALVLSAVAHAGAAPIVEAPAPAPASPAPMPRPTPLMFQQRRSPETLFPTRADAPAPPPVPAPPGGEQALRDLSWQLEAARSRAAFLENTVRTFEAKVLYTQVEMRQMSKTLGQHARDLAVREEELRRLKARLRTNRQEERRVAGRREAAPGDALFLDPGEQFRFEVTDRWARRIPAGEKAARPLRAYRFGPRFLQSLTAIDGVDGAKIADVVVDVLTGLAENSPGREMHQLRSGTGGGDPGLRRDGYTCWRVAIQRHTPQARRLHFWRSADDIELSRVVLHDDFAP